MVVVRSRPQGHSNPEQPAGPVGLLFLGHGSKGSFDSITAPPANPLRVALTLSPLTHTWCPAKLACFPRTPSH